MTFCNYILFYFLFNVENQNQVEVPVQAPIRCKGLRNS